MSQRIATDGDHTTISNIDGGHLFACARCGASQIVRLPMPVADWSAASRRFMKTHRHCRPAVSQPTAADRNSLEQPEVSQP